MLFGRAAIYFDEVARCGALRRAADVLHIAASAVDRQIIQLEGELGTQLFERTPSGMRMTAAGELLIAGVRRWRRDLQRIRSEIDNLSGLRRGKVALALVEGATEFVTAAISNFQSNTLRSNTVWKCTVHSEWSIRCFRARWTLVSLSILRTIHL